MRSSPKAAPALSTLDDVVSTLTRARRLSRQINTILSEESLRDELWRVMHTLDGTHGMLMGEISSALALPAATATKFVDELSDLGLVFRRPGTDDARKLSVYLSRVGKERLDRVEALLTARLAE